MRVFRNLMQMRDGRKNRQLAETTENTGIRIELWGDEIESIRHFNIISQRSTENIEKATIYPAHEYLL